MRFSIAHRITLTFLFAFTIFTTQAQRQLWTVGTANTLGTKDLRIAVFQPSAFGLSNNLELQAQPVAMLIAPNLALKKRWKNKEKFSLATKHGIVYPSFALQQLANAELLSDLAQTDQIPGIFHFKNEILLSIGWGKVLCPSFTSKEFNRKNTFLGPTRILTFMLGLQNGVQFGDGELPAIEEKYLFHHTFPYHGFYFLNFGVDFDARLNTYFDYAVDIDYLHLEGNHYAIEHKALINWWVGRKFFHVAAGYQLSYGEYLEGESKFFVGPVIDLMWTMRRNRIDLGLFGKKMF